MRTTSHRTLASAASFALTLAASGASPPIGTSFSTGADGWSILDLNCNNYGQSVGGGTVTWFVAGGAPGGFIRSTDPSSNCYSYESSAAFEGDRSAYIGGALRWQIRTNVADWLPGSLLILIGNGLTLVSDVPQPTTGAWQPYQVPLTARSFRLNAAAGPAVSEAQFAGAMASLTSIRISAEFGTDAGEETVDIDSIVLVTSCPTDLDGNGVVDAADLAILLGAWGSSIDVTSDLDGSGQVDASDLGVLLGAWGSCD